jgi:hypothetical protein
MRLAFREWDLAEADEPLVVPEALTDSERLLRGALRRRVEQRGRLILGAGP